MKGSEGNDIATGLSVLRFKLMVGIATKYASMKDMAPIDGRTAEC